MKRDEVSGQSRIQSADTGLAGLRHLLETVPVGLCLMDRNLRFVHINKHLAEINGLPADEHIGRTLHEVIPEIAKIVTPTYREVIATGEATLDFEVRGVSPADPETERCWLVSHYPVRSEDGEVIGVSTAVLDITDRERASQARQQSEISHRRLLESTHAVPWQSDVASRCFTYIGPQVTPLLGFPPKDWYREGFWEERIHPDDRALTIRFCEAAARVEDNYQLEYRMIVADGSVVWVQDIVSVERVDGEPKTLRGFLVDVSERRVVQEQLRRSEERYRDLFENAPDMMASVHTETAEVQECNRALEEKLGLARGEILGRSVFDLYHPDSLARARKSFEQFQQSGEARDVELELRRKDGTRLEVSLNASAIRDVGGVIRLCRISWRDITQRKRAVEMLRAGETALRISEDHLRYLTGRLIAAQEEERRRLARELHDDLTQQLAGLAIDTGNLEQQWPDAPEAVRARLGEMRDRIAALSTHVHSISRQLHPSILDDLGLVSAVESECLLFSKREGIPVTFEPSNIPTTLPSDVALCLYRVTQESLRNIAKHAEAAEARISLQATGEEIVLSVGDSGAGFDPDEGRSARGLGLGSMEERVRLIHGRLSIDSEPGRGTIIEVRVPLSAGAG